MAVVSCNSNYIFIEKKSFHTTSETISDAFAPFEPKPHPIPK